MEVALQAIRSQWHSMIDLALVAKKEFQEDADECMRFFAGPYDFMYGLKDATQRGDFVFTGLKKMPRPSIAMTVNKVAEGVQLFGPTLYHRNPDRKVTPRELPVLDMALFGDPNDPNVQATVLPLFQQINQMRLQDAMRAQLLQGMLNYLPKANNLKEESRDCIDEAIIKGLGVLWHYIYSEPGTSKKLIGSYYDSVDNLLIDPDQENIKDAKWVARRRIRPVWEVEVMYGIKPGTLKGNYESHTHISAVESVGNEYKRAFGKTNDLLVYWEIWSRMGLGALLRGISKDTAEADRFGQYVHLVICESYNYPLNLPPSIWDNEQEMYRRAQWETPFWMDRSNSSPWPFTPLIFHKIPRRVWPMSHFRPALGELKFINWAYSFLASGIQKRSRDFIVAPKAACEELKSKILEGSDLELLEIEAWQGKNINEVVSFLTHPEMRQDMLEILALVEKNFEKRTGLNELMYGETPHQFRSAEEANIKNQNLSIRPDDMREKVETMMTEVARKEAMMARWHFDAGDVTNIFGPTIANLWMQVVSTADIPSIIDQLEYTIQAGSTRKKNRDKDVDDANKALQTFLPVFQAFAMQLGQVQPLNSLIQLWGEAFEVDVSGMMVQPPPPPPMPGQPGPGALPQQKGKPQNGQPQPQQPQPAGAA